MNRNFIVLFIAVNVLIVGLGGFLAYSDLYNREYSVRSHTNTEVIEVEYSPLGYRPTYEYYDIIPKKTVVARGSWTLDFFQVCSCYGDCRCNMAFISKSQTVEAE